MKYAIILCVILCGCTETRSERQADTEKHDTITISGTAHVPIPGAGVVAVPIEFTAERRGTESLTEQTQSKTQIDSAAIAQQVGATVGKLVDAGLAKITGMSFSQPATGFTSTETGGLAGAATMAAWALKEMMARRREQQALVEVKAARNKAQDEALDLAKKLPPASVGG